MGRAALQDGQPLRVEGMDHVAHGLPAEADARRDHAHPLALGAGQEDLGTTEDKGIRRAQGGLQGLALRVRRGHGRREGVLCSYLSVWLNCKLSRLRQH